MHDIDPKLRLAVKLEDTRNSVARFFGADYDEKVRPFREIVRAVMIKTGRSALEVGADIGKKAEADLTETGRLLLIAAMVDEAVSTS